MKRFFVHIVLIGMFIKPLLAGELINPATGMPQDVDDWVERYEACEHFAGEGGDTSAGRGISLQLRAHQACFGVLEEHKALGKRYAKNQKALAKLRKADVSWLSGNVSERSTLPLPIAELQARVEMCQELKAKKEQLPAGDLEPYIYEAYGEVCGTIVSDRNRLMRQYRDKPALIAALRKIAFQ